MGENREGEGGKQSLTTDQIARAVAREALSADFEVHSVNVQYVTEGLYAMEILDRDTMQAERFMLALKDVFDDMGPPSAVGGDTGSREER